MNEPQLPPTVQTVQKPKSDPWFEIAQDAEGRWHWCLWSPNGRPLAISATLYERDKDCVTAAKSLAKHVVAAKEVFRANLEE